VALGNFQAPLPELKYNDEISHLRDSFGNMQQSLTLYIDRLKTTTARNAAIENELSIARNIQLSMVPTVFPDRNDIDVYGSMTTAKAVGGDLYDFFVRDDQLFFCIGDVSGKGIPAALLMMETKSLFRAYAKGESMPDRIVSEMNHDLSENNEDCLFVTLFVGILDLTSGLLRYCNAGHEIPFLINKEVRLLPLRPITPIGIDADTPYQTQTFALEPDTIILLFTDGLNEAMDADSKEFGRERILEEASRSILAGQLSSKALIERLTQAVHDFVGDTEQSDDLTMLAIRLR
jgi:sigma-B regulation protein RsbU (phosphoserine phosphatase)